MTVLEALGDYLQTQNAGTLGTDIFLGRMPETPDVCVTLYEYDGVAPTEAFGSEPFMVERPRIQVVCRAGRDDYPTARDKAVQIRDLLAAITEQTISNTRVMRVKALGQVLPLGFDTTDRPTIAVNLECWIGR